MDFVLDEKEVRILGCLIEKEMTTPEYYPLSLNALTNACNQKSNRFPVVSYNEETVSDGLEGLRAKGLARETQSASSRVAKYSHAFLDRFDMSRKEMSVICELLVRGPQTPGELRTRAGRMSPFESLDEVTSLLDGFIAHDPPLSVKLPREAGKKEQRYTHLFSGKPVIDVTSDNRNVEPPEQQGLSEKVLQLEEEIVRLRTEFNELKQELTDLKSRFS